MNRTFLDNVVEESLHLVFVGLELELVLLQGQVAYYPVGLFGVRGNEALEVPELPAN